MHQALEAVQLNARVHASLAPWISTSDSPRAHRAVLRYALYMQYMLCRLEGAPSR